MKEPTLRQMASNQVVNQSNLLDNQPINDLVRLIQRSNNKIWARYPNSGIVRD